MEADLKVEKVMDRQKIASTIHSILDVGVELLQKEKLEQADYGKVKVLRTLGTHMNAAISMVQQETAQLRAAIVVERMKQLGYTVNPQVTE